MNARAVVDDAPPLRLQAGGTLNPRRHLYIERPDDAILLQLLSEGQYVNILTSRQMGKSSLMVRAAQALAEEGVRCAIVDLAAELGSPGDASAYFRGLLNKIARDLKIAVDLAAWWAERADETMNQRLMRFFRDEVLEQVPGPVVCFLDEIDSTLKLAWTDDLFNALRGIHNERPLVPAYERLTFCLIGVASPNELIKDRRTTPYNVGTTLELRDFDLERDDLMPLIASLPADPAQGRLLVERVLHWTGGHPYLTLRLCTSLAEIGAKAADDVDRHVDDSFRSLQRLSEDVHFQQILRFMETRVAGGLATFNLYEAVRKGARERDQPSLAHIELKLSGLVKRNEDGCLLVRNRIYERLFDRHWVKSVKPKRNLQNYRLLALTTSLALLIGSVGSFIWIRYLQTQLGERQKLEELRISVTSGYNSIGTRIGFPEGVRIELVEEAVPLLKHVGPVTKLNLQRAGMSDFDWLINFPDIEVLSLSGSEVTDLTPVAQLSKLRDLALWGTRVANLSPLANLANLEEIKISGRELKDLNPIAKLSTLTELSLPHTRVQDLMPLSNLTEIKTLNLNDTLTRNLRPLTGLTKLHDLDLAHTMVADLSPLEQLADLQSLNLANTELTDVAPLANLTKLRSLYLSGTQVADGAPLANLTNLQWLDLDGTQVADAAPLANLANLQELYLSGTQVADAAPLANLANLQRLDLSGTHVVDAAPLAKLTNLKTLDLSGTKVSQEQVAELRRALAERGNTSVRISGP